jgi:hypothetical protein
VAGAARTSPHGLVQDLLNRRRESLWGFVSNGLTLRLLRDNRSLIRQAYVEFDLAAMMDGQAFSDFVLFWFLDHYNSHRPHRRCRSGRQSHDDRSPRCRQPGCSHFAP